ncbi:protein of unknown function [Candidatus Nitrotoga arctica]|uniref:Uncharacterized protein n=1 Tax=Candidatus Nitrotoga arctica TaxID=453162 RepID=A0ABN8ALQ9_9PROT|nr:protein of unknown function [Candidatus Nitrotoga arctica]
MIVKQRPIHSTHQSPYYAYSEWGDTPTCILALLIIDAIEYNWAFRAILQIPNSATCTSAG